jgi:hypothetical protein
MNVSRNIYSIVIRDRKEMLKYLIYRKKNVFNPEMVSTCISFACKRGSLQMIKMLYNLFPYQKKIKYISEKNMPQNIVCTYGYWELADEFVKMGLIPGKKFIDIGLSKN